MRLVACACGATWTFAAFVVSRSGPPFRLCFCVCRFGQTLDCGEPPVPARGELGHSPGGLVEPVGLYLIEDLSTFLAPAYKPSLLKHNQVLGHSLTGERHTAGQPTGAYLTVGDDEVKHL